MTIEIQHRARLTSGYFGFERYVKPVPATPTHCRGCGLELERLRRYAGLCRQCVAARMSAATAPQPRVQVVRDFVRHGEKFVVVQCACGVQRTMRLSTYNAQRPLTCKACRLAAIKRNGFEAEYAR